MTDFLVDSYSVDKNYPSGKDRFFDGINEMDEIIEFMKKRECPLPGIPPPCDVNLFFGFFFDGTNNNMEWDVPFHSHSNVARLYRAFPSGKDTHGSDVWLCKLDTQLNVSKGVKARALSLGHLCIGM
ncbi:hypothetical protein ACQ4WY_08270 [Janthinobacterium sp. LB2P49]|uniref:hypothetical protein n=1 Tax=Janthinobacterium sp. LB2P49 TaxID=3424198 RepID=UPI003F2742E5